MKYSKKILAAVMAILMSVLSCTVVLADSSDDVEQTRGPIIRTGTYNGYSYTLDTSASSYSLIAATGSYGTIANIKLVYQVKFIYYTAYPSGEVITNAYTIEYGPFSTDDLIKTYTVSDAVTALVANYPSAYYIPDSALFKQCSYSLVINGVTVCSTSRIYIAS